jgi:hypothetical protein
MLLLVACSDKKEDKKTVALTFEQKLEQDVKVVSLADNAGYSHTENPVNLNAERLYLQITIPADDPYFAACNSAIVADGVKIYGKSWGVLSQNTDDRCKSLT